MLQHFVLLPTFLIVELASNCNDQLHRKERGLTILPISFSDLPQSENNLQCHLGTTLPFHMLYAGSPVNANKRSYCIML